ncbi:MULTISPECIES: SPL family radical SAM protein [Cyanophyceae]|nr:radical SAM protein [Nodosilinea sp. FACHB-141]MBD2113635.1 radical SAM protein [Nodosilinea sp. FACHB-141]
MRGIVRGSEKIVNPLQESALHKKGLCDYVVNIASGCLHGCTFCYVPATPAIRTRKAILAEAGVEDPQMEWGNYLFTRDNIPSQLEDLIERKRNWKVTESGKGVVLLCSGTDPYQTKETALITRETVKILLRYKKRVRILTRSPLWIKDLDILCNENVTVGMSLPHFEDELSKVVEPYSPSPSARYNAMIKGAKAGCRLFVAAAPTPPNITLREFESYFQKISRLNPEVVFWEPINARGTNGKRMQKAGLKFVDLVMHEKSWANNFLEQWEIIERAAENTGFLSKLHIWPDKALRKFTDSSKVDYWIDRPTVERWI